MSVSGLSGKVAVVTGASAGIGWATSEELARLGATVVVHARRKERLDELAKKIGAAGGRAEVMVGDPKREEDVDALVARAREAGDGRVDIVVANAGRGLAGGILGSDEKQWRELYEINVVGAAMLMRRAGSVMVEQGAGDIVAIGSAVGQNISPFSGFYGSTKFAISAMAEAMRREVCGKGVRVTLVKPGLVASEFQEVAGYTHENFYRNVEKFGKMLEPADVARVIGFVVSQPAGVHVNDVMVRPTGQDYP